MEKQTQKKYSMRIKADKMLKLMEFGLSTCDISILLDEIKKEAERKKAGPQLT
jgi:hypothetical protein